MIGEESELLSSKPLACCPKYPSIEAIVTLDVITVMRYHMSYD
jgi:hypothetical protein